MKRKLVKVVGVAGLALIAGCPLNQDTRTKDLAAFVSDLIRMTTDDIDPVEIDGVTFAADEDETQFDALIADALNGSFDPVDFVID